MSAPACPMQIDMDAWIDALESLGIPARGQHVVRVDSDHTGITVTYVRRDEDGYAVLGPRDEVATVAVQIGLKRGEQND